ncbi:MAG: hypothetical protein ACRYHA_11230, partial [Janthinobacterium lividum]
MFSDLIQAFLSTLVWSGPVLVAAIVALFVVWKRYTDDLWWTDFWVVFPVVGKMRQWKSQTHGIENIASWRDAGLPPAEEHLCALYIDKLPKIDPVVFNNANEYLKLTHQNGRSPMSPVAWIVLGLLTVAEAAGTGMLIAPFVASEITGNQMVWIGYVIALVMAVGLLGLTHAAGKDIYKRASIRKALGSVNATAEGYSGEKISSGDDQSKDRDASPKTRYGSRVLDGAHDRGSLLRPTIAIALLAVLLIGITWMRIKGIEIDMTRKAADLTISATSGANPFGASADAASSLPMPEAVANASADAQKHVTTELNGEVFSQGIAGAIVLAIIYIITQALGFFQSFGTSFVGDGRNAYWQTRGFTSFPSCFAKVIKPTLDRANMRLTDLRAHLGREVPKYRENVSKFSAYDYYNKKLIEETRRTTDTHENRTVIAEMPRVDLNTVNSTVATSIDSKESALNVARHGLAQPSSTDHVAGTAMNAPSDITRSAERILNETDKERRKVILD